jgi:DNA-binding Lrp family transcriptional regulator
MSKYTRTSTRILFTREMLEDAQKRVNNHESMRTIARNMGIPESTLRKRLKGVSNKHVE